MEAVETSEEEERGLVDELDGREMEGHRCRYWENIRKVRNEERSARKWNLKLDVGNIVSHGRPIDRIVCQRPKCLANHDMYEIIQEMTAIRTAQ